MWLRRLAAGAGGTGGVERMQKLLKVKIRGLCIKHDIFRVYKFVEFIIVASLLQSPLPRDKTTWTKLKTPQKHFLKIICLSSIGIFFPGFLSKVNNNAESPL